MSQNVIVNVVTVAKEFPAGTLDTIFKYILTDVPSASIVATLTDAASTITFPNVADGDYSVSVEKNGVVVEQAFTVFTPNVSLQVPQTVVVTFS